MGGVDKHDWLTSKYATSIRGKKWYWPLFTRVLDMSVVNAWTIYKLLHGEKAEIRCLLEFKRYICVSYLKLSSVAKCSRANSVGHPTSEVRTKAKGHIVARRDKQRRCQNKPCNRKPLSFCQKCDVTLCIECFDPYHNFSWVCLGMYFFIYYVRCKVIIMEWILFFCWKFIDNIFKKALYK